ncbi:hypothetical protein, partial [Actinomadura sp. NPDC049753]|uniref:hypothetical protein n=1 Tax=Actinomadura sp. NPDC049753 TaxID=3154739 RepID=UPI003416EF21
PFDDNHGAKAAGLRAVQIRHQTTHAYERPGLRPPVPPSQVSAPPGGWPAAHDRERHLGNVKIEWR